MVEPEPLTSSASVAWHTLGTDAVSRELESGVRGLTRDEATRRLERYGPNQLEEAPPPSAFTVLLHQFTSPLIYILLVATVVTLVIEEYVDSAVIAAVLMLNAVIGFTQERRAEESVRGLMKLVAPRARVIRDGREWEVESRELVPGDLVLLESGARVPADLRLVETTALRVDESLLTGESLPVTKDNAPLTETDAAVADRPCMAYMGSVVAAGRGRGYVVATGSTTELGAIAEHIRREERVDTPLQQRMTRFAHVVGLVVGISALLTFGIGIWQGQLPTDMFMLAVGLAVAAVPEGLPVVFTITLALGVRRMARRHAIIRRLPAVETLGSTTVIGSDKTGTLTENQMVVQQVWTGGRLHERDPDRRAKATPGDERAEPDSPLYLTLLTGVLTNEAHVYQTDDGSYETQGDPTEVALLVSAAYFDVDPEAVRSDHHMIEDLPFESDRQYSAAVRSHGDMATLYVKGAPERVLDMCRHMLEAHGEVPLDREAILAAVRDMASDGLRVLAMACRPLDGASQRGTPIGEPSELVFLGLQGMMDPPRAGVRDAIRGCRDAGLRVVMITGDHAATALAIAGQLDLADGSAEVLSGRELETLDDDQLCAKVDEVSIYARVSPEQKLRVVRALQARGAIVGVTGDGVNDAPALKAADIGIAMGRNGTDVAREASDMVLADDNFVSIYAAIEEGRVTFDNVRKVTFFLISTGAASIVVLLTSLVLEWPLPMLPAQLLWLNLVTNGLQDVALAFEPGEADVLRRPPRPREEGIVSALLWERTIVAGLVMATGTLAMFQWEIAQTGDLGRAQTVALTTMVLFQMFHVGNSRSEIESVFRRSPFSNPFLFIATSAALAIHVGALYAPWTQFVLRVEPIELDVWIRMLGVAATIVAAMELHKLVRRRPPAPSGRVAAGVRNAG